jgi:hypothetical protein
MRKVLRRPSVSLSLSVALAIISLACFGIPMYVIRPFRHQGAQELAVALSVARFSRVISIGCVLLGLALAWYVWANYRKWLPRITTILFTFLAMFGAFLTRVNVYELMFHPIDSPKFESADKVKVDSDDMVYLLNALPHRSGVEPDGQRSGAHLSPGWHQQSELSDER